ncbi:MULTISPECIES: nuclear transport factor 2 family protein [unclassified Minwuia]|jgi:SnoaL-like domain|uniref:nuclear transport factor 2 family protein n=1 Tax=unclassified Minwuia TaxID=2618799 RepID=UPI00247A1E49|nr:MULTISPECIES: nuclear transport factor 2 family protein [unclassified Minwuia]
MMNAHIENLDRMLAVWNTSDLSERAALTDAALEHNVHFVDPNHNIIGRRAFLAMVEQIQKQIPGARYTRTSNVDLQNNHCRYHWAIHQGDSLLMSGFDVTEVNDAGKIVKVIGFFGELER